MRIASEDRELWLRKVSLLLRTSLKQEVMNLYGAAQIQQAMGLPFGEVIAR